MYISITHLNALLEQLQTYCCNKLPSFSYDIFSDIAFICLMQPTQPAQMQFKVFSAWKLFFCVFCNQIFDLFNKLRAGWLTSWPIFRYIWIQQVLFSSYKPCILILKDGRSSTSAGVFHLLHAAFCHKVFYYNYIYLHSV